MDVGNLISGSSAFSKSSQHIWKFSVHILLKTGLENFEHFQFTLIHGPNIPGSYAVLFFTASDFTFTTRHVHTWALFLLWLSLFIPSGVFLCSFPVAYWAPTNLGSPSFSVISFWLFILFMGFWRQEYWSGLPFPSPVDHILSELSTMPRLSWVALCSLDHSFIELDKAMVHVISLIHFLWLCFSFYLPSEG